MQADRMILDNDEKVTLQRRIAVTCYRTLYYVHSNDRKAKEYNIIMYSLTQLYIRWLSMYLQ